MHDFFLHISQPLLDNDKVKMTNFSFAEDGTQDKNFLFLFLNFYLVPQNLTPKNSPTFMAVKSSRLPPKIATYLVNIGQLLCLAFLSWRMAFF